MKTILILSVTILLLVGCNQDIFKSDGPSDEQVNANRLYAGCIEDNKGSVSRDIIYSCKEAARNAPDYNDH